MSTKYIVIEDNSGAEHLFIFGEELTHENVSMFLARFPVVSAGFLNSQTGQCGGKSISLGKESRPEDTCLAKAVLGLERDRL